MINELMPGIDLLSTFFTLTYIVWLVSREWRSSLWQESRLQKRSLMNQQVSNRHVSWA